MNDLVRKMPKVKNVNKVIVLIVALIFSSCIAYLKYNRKPYTLKKMKSKDGLTKLTVFTYDDHDKERLDAVIIVNRMYFNDGDYKNSKNPLTITIKPNTILDVELLFLSKKTIKIQQIKARERDSIVIKAYMIDEPVYDRSQ